MKFRTRPLLLAAGSLAVVLAAGCNTPTEKTADRKSSDEYVTLEPEVGSRVKKRVKKSELNGYVGMSPNKKDKITADTDMNNIPRTTTGEMEKTATGTGR